MEYQIASYITFLFFSFIITIKIGWVLFKNGEIYLLEIFNHQEAYVKSINKLLLIGYYLINLGKATIEITFWETINNLPDLIRVVGTKLGNLLLILAIMHLVNVIGLTFFSKKQELINN